MAVRTWPIAVAGALSCAVAWSMLSDSGRAFLRVVRYEWLMGQVIVWNAPRTIVECRNPAPDFVALTFGQSNAANSVRGRYQPAADVVWFHDGQCFAAGDPLPGATGTGGSVWSRLGDRLIMTGRYQRVMFAGIAENGSALARWRPGGDLHLRLLDELAAMRRAGVPPTHLLWHQGETDRQLGTDPHRYREDFRMLVAAIRAAGVQAPVFVAQASYCGGRDSAELRAAQRALEDPMLGIFPGPDTDVLHGTPLRHDDCHFSAAGAARHADLWRDALLAVAH
jgi:hypothetical protein